MAGREQRLSASRAWAAGGHGNPETILVDRDRTGATRFPHPLVSWFAAIYQQDGERAVPGADERSSTRPAQEVGQADGRARARGTRQGVEDIRPMSKDGRT